MSGCTYEIALILSHKRIRRLDPPGDLGATSFVSHAGQPVTAFRLDGNSNELCSGNECCEKDAYKVLLTIQIGLL